MDSFPREQVVRLLGLPEGRLRYWERLGLTRRAPRYSLSEVGELRRLNRLAAQGVRVSELLVVDWRQRWMGALEGRAVVRDQKGLKEVGSNQGILDFSPDPEIVPHPSAEQTTAECDQAAETAGHELLHQGRFAEARLTLERELRSQPWSSDLRYNLALALEGTGALEEAAQQLERALMLSPRHADAHYNRARVLELLNRVDEARPHWERFLRLVPDWDPWALQVRRFLARFDG